MRRLLVSWLLCASACSLGRSSEAAKPASVHEDKAEVEGLRNIQRSLRLLASSTPTQRNKVRVLFYGQSITQSSWSRKVERQLAARFPNADLHVENRAIAGFASALLVKTAETDLYPYYPDLLIFHVYGAHDRYEDIIRRVHERTTSEVLLQTDHILKAEELDEQTDAAKLAPRASMWNAFMNNAFLPSLVDRYQTALCDQREAWKRHLRARHEPPSALLRDDIHTNALGDELMAGYVEQCLRSAPELGAAPAEGWVRTYPLGGDVRWVDNKLSFSFEGNRIDAVLREGESRSVAVRIDGKPPSAWPELYQLSRAHTVETGKFPVLSDVRSEAARLLETFTLDVTRVPGLTGAHYTFSLRGDKTGEDGSGSSNERFVSRSKRIVIEPDDWHVEYAFELAEKAVTERFQVELRVEQHFADSFSGLVRQGNESYRVITLAQGLPNTRHTLELHGDGARVTALRVYQPPLGRF